MAKDTVMDEVLILKFFETGPIEKVEVVYNIVNAKMRWRRPVGVAAERRGWRREASPTQRC